MIKKYLHQKHSFLAFYHGTACIVLYVKQVRTTADQAWFQDYSKGGKILRNTNFSKYLPPP